MSTGTYIADLIRRDKQRRKFWTAVRDWIAAEIGNAVGGLINGWFLMLGVGVIHDEWIRQLPTVGYWWACLVVWLLRGVFSRAVPPAKKAEAQS